MTANWRPDLSLQAAFNADPNQIGTVRVYSDLTVRLRAAKQIIAGRQYELNETQAGAPPMTLQDTDEYLNPANEESPYWPNVDAYRAITKQAVWPNDGTTSNYLNPDAPVPATQQLFYDPSFETFAAGDTVPWITVPPWIESLDPVVSTTTPRTGTKDLAYTVPDAVTTVTGVWWPVPCVPGRQYTSSVYVRQSDASTQSIRVTDQNNIVDLFNRTTAAGWGTAAPMGGAWTVTGTAADYSTAPGPAALPWYGTASQSNAAVNTVHLATAGSAIEDSVQMVLITVPVVATGAEVDAGLVARFADASNYYFAELRFNTDQTVGLRIQKRVAGANTSLDAVTLPLQYQAGSQIWLKLVVNGSELTAWAWLDGAVQPSEFAAGAIDTALTAAGLCGARSVLDASNTNSLPVPLTFARYSAVGSVSGSTTTTTGSYVRLSVTWTATQPVHTIQLATQGTTVGDDDVLLDDLQHEQAASASTFVQTGPVIYGVFDGYVERWPARWQIDSQGFEGIAEITTVDAFGPLQNTTLLAAYPQACLSLNPDHYWMLNEPDGAAAYGDRTVAGQVLLTNLVSKYGAGTPPAPSSPNGVPGDPSGVGVAFTPSAAPTTFTQAATILGNGQGGVPGMLLPARIGTSWAMTLAAWVIGQPTDPVASVTLATFYRALSPGLGYVSPIDIGVNSSGHATAHLQNYVAPTSYLASVTSSTQVLDGLPHLIVVTVEQTSGANTVVSIWVDGVFKNSTTVTTASLGGMLAAQATVTNVGGFYDGVTCGAIADATVSHVAVWNRAVSGTEIASVLGGPTSAAGGGWVGETSGQRVRRYLTGDLATVNWRILGAYNGGPVSIDTGMSIMGVDDLSSGTDALTGCQSVAVTENGMFFAGPTSLNFAGRERRYLQTEALYTFGEDTAGGEIPYQPDVGFDWDPTIVYNPVVVTNSSGIIATSANPTLIVRYFARAYPRSINVADDNEAVDAANYLLAQHDRPRMRVDQIVIDAGSNADFWPVALRAQLNDRVSVVRRAKAANTGAGIVMSGDYFIDLKEVEAYDEASGQWTVRLQMSPVDISQVWILEDAVYGVLDETTVLGY